MTPAALGFGRSRSRVPRRTSPYRPSYRRYPPYRRSRFGRSILRAIGIAFLFHALFGWGAGGGSPLGLLLLVAIVWLLFRASRRRGPGYAAW